MKKKFTGERLETHIHNGNAINHLHRYALASNYIKNKIVLDIASGEGYGSNLMSEYAEFVYGVDIDRETIENAQAKYKNKNIKFYEGSTSKIPLENKTIDVVISFETIEHHDKHEEMLDEIKRVLKPNGLLIISTPDKYFYSDKRNYKNEFHVKELYKNEFIDLINNYFNNYQLLLQSYLNGSSLIFEESIRENIEFYKGNYVRLESSFSNPHFLISICSNTNFKRQNSSIFEGSMIMKSSNEYENLINKIYASNSYKLGHALLYVFKYLKRFFKKAGKDK